MGLVRVAAMANEGRGGGSQSASPHVPGSYPPPNVLRTSGPSPSLPPGSVLDALVAEKVLGWHRWDPPQSILHHGLQWYWTDGEAQEDSQGISLPSERAKNTWHPSTSIAAAWDVVEKIVQEYRWCDLTFNGTAWECQINLEKCIAPSAPLAICLAALKAVGYDCSPLPALRDSGP